MSGRLLAIEARRNVGPYFMLLILGATWYLMSLEYWVPFLWSSTDDLLQRHLVSFAAPAMTGAAAWMAGRDRRRSVTDLLATTAKPVTLQRLTLMAATVVWGLLAYFIVAAIMLGRSAFAATSGGPRLWPILTVIAAIIAHAGWGFLAGQLIHSRFVAPIAAVAALGLQQFAAGSTEGLGDSGYTPTWIASLAAHNGLHPVAQWQALFYTGLALTAVAAIAVASHRSIPRWTALAGTSTVVIASVIMIWGEYPRWSPVFEAQRNGWGQVIDSPEWASPPQTCRGAPVEVCVSQEYEPILDTGVIAANALAEPLLGLSGVPLRVEREEAGMSVGPDDSAWLDVGRYATRLVADAVTLEQGEISNEAQHAIRVWLLDRAGITAHPNCSDLALSNDWQGAPTAAACDAASRFAGLPNARQRAWLVERYADLRAGILTLADLP